MLGLLVTGAGVAASSFIALMIGPVLVLVGLGPALARNFPRRTVTSTLAVIVLAWGVLAVPVALALHSSIDVFLFVAQGLMLVGAAVVLVSQQQGAIGHVVGRVATPVTSGSPRPRLPVGPPLPHRR